MALPRAPFRVHLVAVQAGRHLVTRICTRKGRNAIDGCVWAEMTVPLGGHSTAMNERILVAGRESMYLESCSYIGQSGHLAEKSTLPRLFAVFVLRSRHLRL